MLQRLLVRSCWLESQYPGSSQWLLECAQLPWSVLLMLLLILLLLLLLLLVRLMAVVQCMTVSLTLQMDQRSPASRVPVRSAGA